jgi:hypothetical protein
MLIFFTNWGRLNQHFGGGQHQYWAVIKFDHNLQFKVFENFKNNLKQLLHVFENFPPTNKEPMVQDRFFDILELYAKGSELDL